MTSNTRGILLALAGAGIYGLVPVFARLAFNNGIPALESVLARTFVIAVVLAIAAVLLNLDFRIPRRMSKGFVFQVLATTGVSLCFLASVQFVPVTLSAVIFYTFPIVILLATPLVEGHAPSWKRLAVAFVAFIGLAISLGPQFDSLDPRGLGLAALASLSCAAQFFAGRLAAGKMHPAPYASIIHIIVFPIVVLFMIGFDAFPMKLPTASPMALLAITVLSLAYVAAYFLHMLSLRHAPASVVAPFFNFEPVTVTAAAILVLGETLAVTQIAGGLLILAALLAGAFVERSSPT